MRTSDEPARHWADHLQRDGGRDRRRGCVHEGPGLCRLAGAVPKQISTGDRTILGKISRRGNRYLRVLFVQVAEDQIPTDLLLQHLLTLDDGRWTEFRGEHGNQAPKPLTRPTMTKMISVFGVRTKTLWPRHRNASAKSTRGYTRQDFERAWAAYCDDEGNTPTHLSIIKHLRRP